MKGNVIHHAINHINHNIYQVCVRQNTKLEHGNIQQTTKPWPVRIFTD